MEYLDVVVAVIVGINVDRLLDIIFDAVFK
jgi:hypothetical protein